MAITYDYKVGLKKEVLDALAPIFGASYPDVQLRDRVRVSMEYPLAEIEYPAIILHFQEESIQSGGIGGFWVDEEEKRYRHWFFEGTLNFVILTKSPQDRDMLSAGLVSLLSFGDDLPEFKSFYSDIEDADYVAIQLLNGTIQPLGDQVGTVPWENSDEQLYNSTYSIRIFGEFYSEATSGGLIQISSVGVFPYTAGQPIPQGSSDSAPWI
jgi:hypothetical protein